MLNTPAPFPQVGSDALYEDEGRTVAVRILGRALGTGDATISIPSRFGIASGNKTVPLADLIDATPLSEAEQAEYRQLERTVPAAPSRSPKVKAEQARYEELRLRAIHSQTLATLLAAPARKAA